MKRAKQNKVAPAPTVDFEVFNIMDDAPANVLDLFAMCRQWHLL